MAKEDGKGAASSSTGATTMKKKARKPALDARFDTSADPRFKRMPQKDRKVKVDSRFKAMFSKEFAEPSAVDRTGKRMGKSGSLDMKKFYELEEEQAELSPADDEAEVKTTTGADEDETEFVWNEESSESEGEDGEVAEDQDAACWEEEDAVTSADTSRRIAIQNADWDNVNADDLFMLLQGFLEGHAKSKKVNRLAIYPSDYGLEKMAHEKIHGPQIDGLDNKPSKGDGEETADTAATGEEDEEGLSAIRQYQRQRLKYRYAVAECDSVDTAVYLYDNLDGLNVDYIFPVHADMRFVPDEIDFPHEPTSVCCSAPKGYVIPGTAGKDGQGMRHSKVKCSWDDDSTQKRKFLTKRFSEKELMDMDMQAYLASSSEDELDENNLEDYRAKLLGGDSDDEKKSDDEKSDDEEEQSDDDDGETGDMTVTFNPALEQLATEVQERALAAAGKGTLKKSGLDKKVLTPWDQYIEKKQKQKEARKAERKAQEAKEAGADRFGKLAGQEEDEADDDDMLVPSKKEKSKNKKAGKNRWDLSVDYSSAGKEKARLQKDQGAAQDAADLDLLIGNHKEKKHFDLNVKSKKKKKKAGLDVATDKYSANIDVADSRLSKLFEDPDFAIDATNPAFKQTDGMAALLAEKAKRRKQKRELSAKKQQERQVSEKRKKGEELGDISILGKKKKKRKLA